MCPSQSPESKPATNAPPVLMLNKEVPPGSEKASEGQLEKPKISLLQSSKERLRRRLKDKVLKSCLLPVRAHYSNQDQHTHNHLVSLLSLSLTQTHTFLTLLCFILFSGWLLNT